MPVDKWEKYAEPQQLPQTLPKDFNDWDKPPDTLPANFSDWDQTPQQPDRWEQYVEHQPAPGVIVNDIGNRVIVPKQGESFADTMRRAAAYGKTVTPAQVNAEMATSPKKAAQVLATAPLAGLLGAGGLAGAGEAGFAAPALTKALGPGLKAAAQWTAAHPVATAMAYHLARKLGLPLPKILDLLSDFKGE